MNEDLIGGDGKRTIVMVDDNISNLATGKAVLKDRFEVFTVPSAEKFFTLMRVIKPDLILLDIEMPGMNGYTVMQHLMEDNRDFDIPVIFLTAKTDPGSELEGLTLGAVDYIFKPFSPLLLIKRIENCILMFEQQKQLKRFNENLRSMVSRQTTQIAELQSSVFDVISNLVEFRDDVTGDHISRTTRLLEILLDAMLEQGIYASESESWERELLLTSAKLHDVGKIGISDVILNKPGKLTPEEYEAMKKHVEIGNEIVKRIRETRSDAMDDTFLYYADNFVAFHHEHWNGKGYPHGIAGMDIPLLGRLMAVVDVYDALVSKRPYKEALPLDVSHRIMQEGRGEHFDPQLIDLFMHPRVISKIDAVTEEIQNLTYRNIGL